MVHKKSEYRLSYKWLPAEIKREILETSATNLDYRVERRRRDLWHHPWEWCCLDDACECDEIDEGDQFLPLPPLRQKHRMLVDEWNRKAPAVDVTPRSQHLQPQRQQTPLNVEHKFHPKYIETKSPDQLRNTSFRSIGDARFSPLPINEAAAVGTVKPAVVSRTDLDQHSNRIKDYSSVKDRFDGRHRLNVALSDRPAYEVRNPRRRRTDVVPTVVPSRKPSAVVHRPSSTLNRQPEATRDQRKPPFHTYGAANAVNTIGKQHTHNIRVQSNEVHPTALLAKKIKNELSQPNLINFATKKSKSSSILTNFSCPINHSSLWTTEYQRNFSTKGP